jgi:hypothetical protein
VDAPDLIIPIRMEPSKATAALSKVGAAGKKTGDDVDTGAGAGKKGINGLGDSGDKATTSILALSKTYIGFATIQSVAMAVGDEFKKAADYVKELASKFIELQKTLQSLASLEGKQNQNEYTQQEVAKEAANLKPEEMIDFRTKFMAKASMYVGDKETSKMTQEDADKLQGASAEFAKGKGINAGTMADFVGGMLAQEKSQVTAEEMLAKFGEVYATLEASSTDPEKLMQGMIELMAAGFPTEKAAPMIAVMSEIAPGQEATYIQRTTTELGQQQREDKIGEKQQLYQGMEPREQLEAVIKDPQKEMEAGETPEKKEKILQQKASEITGEVVAFQTITSVARQELGLMEAWEDITKNTPDDKVYTDIEADRKFEVGRRRHEKVRLAAGEAKIHGVNVEVDMAKIRVQVELTEEHAFDKRNVIGQLARGAYGKLSGGDVKQRLINEQALYNAQKEHAAISGHINRYASERTDLLDASRAKTFAATGSQADVDNELKAIMKEVAENTAKMVEQKEKSDGPKEKPVSVPVALTPMRSNGRMS